MILKDVEPLKVLLRFRIVFHEYNLTSVVRGWGERGAAFFYGTFSTVASIFSMLS